MRGDNNLLLSSKHTNLAKQVIKKIIMKEFLQNAARALALLSILISSAACAHASTVTWTLVNVNFIGGGRATGSFTFDNSALTATSWDITVFGTPAADYVYNSADSPADSETCCDSATQVAFASFDPTDGTTFSRYLFLVLDGTMTNAGGTIALDSPATEACPGACSDAATGARITSDPITNEATTPEPASILMSACGAFILGLLLYRKRQASAGIAR